MDRPSESRRPMVLALLATVTLVLAIVFGPRLWRAATTRSIPADPLPTATAATLDGIDMRRVHVELLPAWVVTRNQPNAPLQEELAFEALHAALAPNAALAELMEQLRWHTDPRVLWREEKQALALATVRRWNDAMQAAEIPYMLRANLMVTGDDIRFYALSYEVVSRGHARVLDVDLPVAFLRRVDHLNMREWYVGMVRDHEEGVVIILDNAVELALDHVWPMLATDDGPHRDELAAAFAHAVAEEARRDLPPETLAVLQAHAAWRRALTETVEAIESRTTCGTSFQARTIPWNGFNDDELAPFREQASQGSRPCSAVTEEELDAIVDASAALHDADDLRPAVESLVAWLTRPLVIHEARHAADLQQKTTATERTCSWCGPTDSAPARLELSAFLAELSWTESPALALYLMCHATARDPGVGHGEALEAILGRADHPCSAGPLPRATEVMRGLEAEAYGRGDAIAWVGELPTRMPVDNLRVGR